MHTSARVICESFSFMCKFHRNSYLLSPKYICSYSKVWRRTFVPINVKYISEIWRHHSTMDSHQGQLLEQPTAGIIVIGDEILKGRTKDSNSHFLAQRLQKLGIKVKKISVIGDEVGVISREVQQFSKSYTHVITTGGVGPTHDDVTLQGVADAFGDNLVAHPDLVAVISGYFKTTDLSSPAMKMAHIPSKAVLVYGEDRATGYKASFPVLTVSNVTVLPGVPKLLEKAFTLLDKQLFGDHRELPSCEVYLRVDEVSIAAALNATVAAHPTVTIGSYPKLMHSYYKTHVTMEASEAELVEGARQHFLQQLDPGHVVSDYVSDSLCDPWERLQSLLQHSPALQQTVDSAVEVLHRCLRQYRAEETCIFFNGGKDCLVVLHLYYCVLCKLQQKRDAGTAPLQAVYITEDNSFPQVTQFVQQTINRYNLQCSVLPGPLKPALQRLLDDRPAIKAVIMGTRRTDPYSETLGFFHQTDNGWPEIMRVHPILDWQYDTVWSFIRGLYLPYCTLYDRGYTSLGNAGNTVQNPHLQTKNPLGNISYRPAHMLTDPKHERTGRT